nr:four helix bundle protein [bacterium]
MIKSYRDLKVWQFGMQVAGSVHTITKSFPKEELYGLVSQLRKAAVSIPSNIAEGHARKGTGEYIYHLSVAQGSVAEVETQLLLAVQFEYIKKQEILPLLEKLSELGKMLNALMASLKKNP